MFGLSYGMGEEHPVFWVDKVLKGQKSQHLHVSMTSVVSNSIGWNDFKLKPRNSSTIKALKS